MSHDFSAKHGGDSGPCNGQGIMRYGSYSYDQWSTCSQADFKEHYFGLNWENCFDDISGEDAYFHMSYVVLKQNMMGYLYN